MAGAAQFALADAAIDVCRQNLQREQEVANAHAIDINAIVAQFDQQMLVDREHNEGNRRRREEERVEAAREQREAEEAQLQAGWAALAAPPPAPGPPVPLNDAAARAAPAVPAPRGPGRPRGTTGLQAHAANLTASTQPRLDAFVIRNKPAGASTQAPTQAPTQMTPMERMRAAWAGYGRWSSEEHDARQAEAEQAGVLGEFFDATGQYDEYDMP